jgi:hypothetical protein
MHIFAQAMYTRSTDLSGYHKVVAMHTYSSDWKCVVVLIVIVIIIIVIVIVIINEYPLCFASVPRGRDVGHRKHVPMSVMAICLASVSFSELLDMHSWCITAVSGMATLLGNVLLYNVVGDVRHRDIVPQK